MGSRGEADGGEEHAEPVVVAVAVPAGEAALSQVAYAFPVLPGTRSSNRARVNPCSSRVRLTLATLSSTTSPAGGRSARGELA